MHIDRLSREIAICIKLLKNFHDLFALKTDNFFNSYNLILNKSFLNINNSIELIMFV